MQVPARWPNAFWRDKSIFMGPERWARAAAGGAVHDTEHHKGVMIDAGECSQCCPLSVCWTLSPFVLKILPSWVVGAAD